MATQPPYNAFDDIFDDENLNLDLELEDIDTDSPYYGAGDDDDLPALEAEVDAETFGQESEIESPEDIEWASTPWSLPEAEETSEEQSQFAEPMAQGNVEDLFELGNVLLPTAYQDGTLETLVKWATSSFGGDDARGIVTAMQDMKNPSLADWKSMNESQRETFVMDAIKRAAIPGIPFRSWDKLQDAWNQGNGPINTAWKLVTTTPSALWSLVSRDFPTLTAAWIDEVMPIPGVELTRHEVLNQKAMFYWFLEMLGYDVVKGIAAQMTVYFDQYGYPTPVGEQAFEVPSTEVEVEEGGEAFFPGPAMEIAPPRAESVLPRPQTILAFGYGLMIAGSLTGLIK